MFNFNCSYYGQIGWGERIVVNDGLVQRVQYEWKRKPSHCLLFIGRSGDMAGACYWGEVERRKQVVSGWIDCFHFLPNQADVAPLYSTLQA